MQPEHFSILASVLELASAAVTCARSYLPVIWPLIGHLTWTVSCDWSAPAAVIGPLPLVSWCAMAAAMCGMLPPTWAWSGARAAVILRGHGVISQLLMLETRKINILKSPSALPEWWISDSVRRTCKADIAQCGDGDPMAVFSVSGTLWHCWHSSADSSGHQRKGARGSLVLALSSSSSPASSNYLRTVSPPPLQRFLIKQRMGAKSVCSVQELVSGSKNSI